MLEKILFGEKNETTIQKFIKKIKVEIVCKEFRDFNLDLYDEPFKYYNDLQKYLFYILESQDLANYFNYFVDESFKKSYISIYYFSALLDLLIELLTTNPLAHQDNIIKFDISVICEFFRGKNMRLCCSNSFFYCCVIELLEKYKIELPKRNEFRNKIFQKQKEHSSNTFEKVKKNLSNYIQRNLKNYCAIKDEELIKEKFKIKNEKEANEYEKSQKDLQKLIQLSKENIILPNNYENAKKLCEEKNISYYLGEYADYILKKKYYSTDADKKKYKEYILNNCLLPINILNIDEKEEKNIQIISIIDYDENITFKESLPYGETFYEKYLNIKEELDYLNKNCYEQEIREILDDKSFQKDFLTIFESQHVNRYLKAVIEFDNDLEDDYKFKLYDLSKETNHSEIFNLKLKGDIYLGEQYDSFLKDIKKDFNSIKKLIVIKELGYKVPSCTGPSMRIFINPRLQFSQEAIQNKSQRNSILRSALIILLLHEIAHLLKYYPINNKYPNKCPFTPKNKENGKCFMHFLFDKEIINKIYYHQSSKITVILIKLL